MAKRTNEKLQCTEGTGWLKAAGMKAADTIQKTIRKGACPKPESRTEAGCKPGRTRV